MRKIGFSTGAIAYSDFRRGVEILRRKRVTFIELSALRQHELSPLVTALDELDLRTFEYVSVHAPSRIDTGTETKVLALLEKVLERRWPIVVHPDVVTDFRAWRRFGDLLLVENMDKRKNCGRTVQELEAVFENLPEANLCLDLGHAQQVDTTMTEAKLILNRFRSRLRQLHLSEVSTSHTHNPLSIESTLAFQNISADIPVDIPVILESRVRPEEVEDEIAFARRALPVALGTRV